MSKRPKNLDLNQLAKRIVDEAIGDESITPEPKEKNQAAVELGKLGGIKGGKARSERLTPEQRSDIAKKASQKRWGIIESTASDDGEELQKKKKRGVIPSPDA